MFDLDYDSYESLPTVDAPALADASVPSLYHEFLYLDEDEEVETARAYAREVNHDRGLA